MDLELSLCRMTVNSSFSHSAESKYSLNTPCVSFEVYCIPKSAAQQTLVYAASSQ